MADVITNSQRAKGSFYLDAGESLLAVKSIEEFKGTVQVELSVPKHEFDSAAEYILLATCKSAENENFIDSRQVGRIVRLALR